MMTFRLLEVNLSTGEKKVTDVSEDFRKYLGGRGYGAKLLWDRVPQGADPLGEENILYFGVGPITGFLGSLCERQRQIAPDLPKGPIEPERPLSGLNSSTPGTMRVFSSPGNLPSPSICT